MNERIHKFLLVLRVQPSSSRLVDEKKASDLVSVLGRLGGGGGSNIAFFKDTARAQISGDEVGMLKILFHLDTQEILGIHCFGAEAAEIVHIGQAIMNQTGEANNINYFTNTTFNYPTMAEAYRVAALNGLNRLKRQ